ncbi:unnamed protein product [Euphydryas editha]|uniref:CTNNB1 binding N-teminal domain-containing protein n=1 Tax=Euphydryas editha TaxID=104508 RepID=A0AAU9UIZ2_EUPED|nr:unnamed protein product [Euphydryas editha]
MPHAHSSSAASSGGDDLGSTDEVKVFKDEGDGEDEKRSSENLLEEKSSLIDWTESEEGARIQYMSTCIGVPCLIINTDSHCFCGRIYLTIPREAKPEGVQTFRGHLQTKLLYESLVPLSLVEKCNGLNETDDSTDWYKNPKVLQSRIV